MKRQQEKEGKFFKVPLEDGYHTYGRIIAGKYFAFYDSRTREDLPLTEIAKSPVLFIIGVYKRAITKGFWEYVGELPLEPKFQEEPRFFMQDVLNPKRLRIYHKGKETPATIEEVQGLERMSVWDVGHVQDRLNDHYAGRPCPWLKDAKPKPF